MTNLFPSVFKMVGLYLCYILNKNINFVTMSSIIS